MAKYTESEAKAFIDKIAPMIIKEGKKRGYSVFSTTIAQAIIEGACGKSTLAQEPYNNHFGMKCGSSWKGRSVNMKTMENYGAGLVAIRDNFRCYDSMEDCVKGYYDFISAKRYENLKTAVNYRQFAEFLKLDKYATSEVYVSTLCNTVERYVLSQFDVEQTVPLHIKNRRILRKGMQGSDVLLMQQILKKEMYDIGKSGADGIFGNNTLNALKQFQKEKGLVDDGICGPKTWMMLEKYN